MTLMRAGANEKTSNSSYMMLLQQKLTSGGVLELTLPSTRAPLQPAERALLVRLVSAFGGAAARAAREAAAALTAPATRSCCRRTARASWRSTCG